MEEDRIAISSRAVWRVLPVAGTSEQDELFCRVALTAFRGVFIANHASYAAIMNAKVACRALMRDATHAEAYKIRNVAEALLATISPVDFPTVESARKSLSSKSEQAQFWDAIDQDCNALKTTGAQELLSRPLWSAQPESFRSLSHKFCERLDRLGGAWPLIGEWYSQLLVDPRTIQFPPEAVATLSNMSSRSWYDRGARRTPNTVIDEIASILGWVRTELRDSSPDPSFVSNEPIVPDRGDPAPIVPRDQNYYFSASKVRRQRLSDAIDEKGKSGEQSLNVLQAICQEIESALGSSSQDIFITALVAENRSLAGQLAAQERYVNLPEANLEFELAEWPIHIKALANDLYNVVSDLIENDRIGRQVVQAPDDEELTQADIDFVRAARVAIEQVAQFSGLFAPATMEL